MARFFSFVLLGLLLAACGGKGPLIVPNSIDEAAPSVAQSQPPVRTEGADVATEGARIEPPALEPAGIERPEAEKTESTQRAGGIRILAQKTKAQQRTEETWQGPQEEGEAGEAMSLYVRNDEGEEEDLTALLTEDYAGQFDIPIVFNEAVQYFIRYFTTEKRKIFANWLKRSRRYVPMIKEILRDQGLPEDLLYLAMIESGFNPKAYSPMKACGPWQFIYSTGGRYGLRVNHWVDERRDPEKSTVAAALYLKDLFNQFGNWYLVAASFNAGEKRVERAVEKHETSDFWELSKYNTLPRETREYIPRLLAAAIIAKEPERFGFTNITYDQPITFTSERVPGGIPLTALAKAASTSVTEVSALNPELLTGITPPDVDDYTIRLPQSIRKGEFREDLDAALEREERVEGVTAYTCKRRDRLALVMKRFGVTYNDLALVNGCALVAKQGAVIYIPRIQAKEEPQEEKVALGKPSRHRLSKAMVQAKAAGANNNRYHIVRRGENLAGISEKYGIDLETLKHINRLKKGQIYPNMRIVLVSPARNIGRPLRISPASYGPRKNSSRLAVASKGEKSPHAFKEANRGRKGTKAHSNARPRIRLSKARPSRLG